MSIRHETPAGHSLGCQILLFLQRKSACHWGGPPQWLEEWIIPFLTYPTSWLVSLTTAQRQQSRELGMKKMEILLLSSLHWADPYSEQLAIISFAQNSLTPSSHMTMQAEASPHSLPAHPLLLLQLPTIVSSLRKEWISLRSSFQRLKGIM